MIPEVGINVDSASTLPILNPKQPTAEEILGKGPSSLSSNAISTNQFVTASLLTRPVFQRLPMESETREEFSSPIDSSLVCENDSAIRFKNPPRLTTKTLLQQSEKPSSLHPDIAAYLVQPVSDYDLSMFLSFDATLQELVTCWTNDKNLENLQESYTSIQNRLKVLESLQVEVVRHHQDLQECTAQQKIHIQAALQHALEHESASATLQREVDLLCHVSEQSREKERQALDLFERLRNEAKKLYELLQQGSSMLQEYHMQLNQLHSQNAALIAEREAIIAASSRRDSEDAFPDCRRANIAEPKLSAPITRGRGEAPPASIHGPKP